MNAAAHQWMIFGATTELTLNAGTLGVLQRRCPPVVVQCTCHGMYITQLHTWMVSTLTEIAE